MTPTVAAQPGARAVAGGLALGLLLGGFAFLVWVGLSGELGRVLSGVVQAKAPAGDAGTGTLQWGLALATTAAVMYAPVGWRSARGASPWPIAAAVLACACGAVLLAPSASAWAAVALPALIASTAYLVMSLARRRQEPLRRGGAAPLPQLSWSVALSALYGVGAALTFFVA